MRSRFATASACFGLMLGCAGARAQVFVVGMNSATADVTTEFHPTHVSLPEQPLDQRGKLDLIRNLEAEQGFAHRELPLGAGITLTANGNMTPHDTEYRRMLYEKGQSAAIGERVEVSKLEFRPDRIVVDFNGGPYAKHRFLSHVSINNAQLAPTAPTATGCRITLIFEGGVPDVTAAEVKALLDPLVDFKAKSSAEAYADSLPPKVREAVEAHHILVGMNRRMVLAALGEPKTKHREHVAAGDDGSAMYEEWIYGDPPAATQFVRFRRDKVVRLEIAAIGKPIEVHERNETGEPEGPVLTARTVVNGDVHASPDQGSQGRGPTLRKPGETEETVGGTGLGKVKVPQDTVPATSPAQPASPGAAPH